MQSIDGPSTVWNCRGAIIRRGLQQAKMKLKLTNCTAAQIHYAACVERRSGTKMADTQRAVKVKSPVSINIMVCPPGCSTLLGISTI